MFLGYPSNIILFLLEEFLITVFWPDNLEDDVDIYVEDPAGNLVWFKSREPGLMHLDRDDLGKRNDEPFVNQIYS